MSQSIRAAAVQFQHVPGNKRANLKIMEALCTRAAG